MGGSNPLFDAIRLLDDGGAAVGLGPDKPFHNRKTPLQHNKKTTNIPARWRWRNLELINARLLEFSMLIWMHG